MKNFKEIAEKCLAGELIGTFKLVSGELLSSDNLERMSDQNDLYKYQMRVHGIKFSYTIYGTLFSYHPHELDIINFIPNNMQEQIKIDIPEGKVPVMDQTEKGVVITWKEKELTYTELSDKFKHNPEYIHSSSINSTSRAFFKKVEVLRKLTNIRNYFGKCSILINGYHICRSVSNQGNYEFKVREFCTCDPHEVVFAKKEHAEQAIKMLGDELKYLFEPW